MVLLRRVIGDVLRRHRLRQSRTLREVSSAARVSLGYLSEVERGRKEASSELLDSICAALGVTVGEVLREAGEELLALERRPAIPTGFATAPSVRPVATRPAARVAGLAPARVAGVAPLVAGRGTADVAATRPRPAPVATLSGGHPPVVRMSARSVVAA